eukprot:TRINITY_DN24904_c0_g2_i1.p3 TRINITY_DN24904_c0_g2~~TRINITY_DN24904_c0_g2_i1.p3  ORF type:complete len:126 (-),score=17.25 TRINITY_DN24904_c0_g2_i1:202-579(-)
MENKFQIQIQRSRTQEGRMPTQFESRVYKVCSMIPKGKVITYANLAKVLESSPRAVGQALKRNPFAPEVPCHRVVAANMDLGGYSGQWGEKSEKVSKKMNLLKEEGVQFIGSKICPVSLWLLKSS